MSNIESFRASINQYSDFAKTSRFWVYITNPPGGGDTELLKYRCFSAELPGRTFSTFENRTYGLFQTYPAQTTYNQLNLEFLCSSNKKGPLGGTGFAEKKIFEDWMDYINPTENDATNISNNPLYNFRYRSEYVRDITVIHYDIVGNNGNDMPDYQVTFIECFPISINQITLNWSNEENATLNVTFAYKRWQRGYFPRDNKVSQSDIGVITTGQPPPTPSEEPGELSQAVRRRIVNPETNNPYGA